MSLKEAVEVLANVPKINIKGKMYTQVSTRMEVFRQFFPDHALITDMLPESGALVRVKATICTPDGQPIATGLAEEDRGFGNINKTSALENCETSAIGRALANFGLHGGEYASANEMDVALKQQSQAIKGGVWPGDESGADKLKTSKSSQKKEAPPDDLPQKEAPPDDLPRNEQEWRVYGNELAVKIKATAGTGALDMIEHESSKYLAFCPSEKMVQAIADEIQGRREILTTPDRELTPLDAG